MKDKKLKIGLMVAGAFSSILAVRESRKMKKMMEETSGQRNQRAREVFRQAKEEMVEQEDKEK